MPGKVYYALGSDSKCYSVDESMQDIKEVEWHEALPDASFKRLVDNVDKVFSDIVAQKIVNEERNHNIQFPPIDAITIAFIDIPGSNEVRYITGLIPDALAEEEKELKEFLEGTNLLGNEHSLYDVGNIPIAMENNPQKEDEVSDEVFFAKAMKVFHDAHEVFYIESQNIAKKIDKELDGFYSNKTDSKTDAGGDPSFNTPSQSQPSTTSNSTIDPQGAAGSRPTSNNDNNSGSKKHKQGPS